MGFIEMPVFWGDTVIHPIKSQRPRDEQVGQDSSALHILENSVLELCSIQKTSRVIPVIQVV